MAPKKQPKRLPPSIPVTFRISREHYDQLRLVAKIERRGLGQLVRILVEDQLAASKQGASN